MKRRSFLASTGGIAALSAMLDSKTVMAATAAVPHQATGVRIGEVTADSAVIWTRLTQSAERNHKGVLIPGLMNDYRGRGLPEPTVPVGDLEGACPATSGLVRLRYATSEQLEGAIVTEWHEATVAHDGITHIRLTDLKPATTYHFVSECAASPSNELGTSVRGKFRTAPKADDTSPVRFCVMTCQGYPDRGHADGHGIYPSMLALEPHFACLAGDLVYYDNDMPRAKSPDLARYHWQRMFSLPRLVEFHRQTSAYWLKDDHDTLSNDSWPGKTMGKLTFEEGQQIFRQQAPWSDGPAYRTFRWGRDVQIWLTEGRDHRTPNNQPDGENKSILGDEQKAWLKSTLLASDATWKILVSPTPYVGPDRPTGKADNHSNGGFQHEGDELRNWFAKNVEESFLIICGDRHWQYHSIHPELKLHEFSVGAASDEHAGGSPGKDPKYHQFHRVSGGFLSVECERNDNTSKITCRHHDIQGKVRYEFARSRQI